LGTVQRKAGSDAAVNHGSRHYLRKYQSPCVAGIDLKPLSEGTLMVKRCVLGVTQGVLRPLRMLRDRAGRNATNCCAHVREVLAAAPLENLGVWMGHCRAR